MKTTYVRPTAKDHLDMMYAEGRWPAWPILPLKHSTKRDADFPGMPMLAYLVSGDGATVYVGTIGMPVESVKPYPDFEAVVADGWVVD